MHFKSRWWWQMFCSFFDLPLIVKFYLSFSTFVNIGCYLTCWYARKYQLVDVTVVRSSDLEHGGQEFITRTHLGRILNYGDTVMGFVCIHLNWLLTLAICYSLNIDWTLSCTGHSYLFLLFMFHCLRIDVKVIIYLFYLNL